MDIAIIVDALFPDKVGGIQKYSTSLADALAKAGLGVTVYVEQDCPLATKQLQIEGVNVVRVEHKRYAIPLLGYLLSNRSFSQQALSQASKNGHAVIYAQGLAGIGAAQVKSNVPVVHNFHGLEMYQPVKGLKARAIAALFRVELKKLFKLKPIVVSLGSRLSEIIKKQSPQSQIFQIPNGIHENWFISESRKFRTEGKKFLFVGRDEWRKGVPTLNQAEKSLSTQANFSGTFYMVGPFQENKKQAGMQYLGEKRDENELKEIYKDMDVLVCPSYSEGMPTVILEAMASGLPVIATDVGASAELVDNGNGRLIKPFDIEGLVQALLEFSQKNEATMQQMSLATLTKASTNYKWEQVADKHIAVFKQICGEQ